VATAELHNGHEPHRFFTRNPLRIKEVAVKHSQALIIGLAWTVLGLEPVNAETVAVIAICEKGQTTCNKQNARSVYRIPLDGSICFVPVQQKLAELGVYDEEKDDIRITCETKAPG
jgi:hypothetical protein